ncbi:hypothetical protein [Archangium primigenium]|uniref:hypothetical protein n=1 Tax=[Archangium] primigenium TaxID=2792470 RepID=UPI00195B2AE7|nr:hypothetical protein [Archangium primigenium]MBM7115577.1 hypothetical protein [Archangium primigenium]
MKKLTFALVMTGSLLTACGPEMEGENLSGETPDMTAETAETAETADTDGKVTAMATTWQTYKYMHCASFGQSCYNLIYSKDYCANYTGNNNNAQGVACSVPGTYCWVVTQDWAVSYQCK